MRNRKPKSVTEKSSTCVTWALSLDSSAQANPHQNPILRITSPPTYRSQKHSFTQRRLKTNSHQSSRTKRSRSEVWKMKGEFACKPNLKFNERNEKLNLPSPHLNSSKLTSQQGETREGSIMNRKKGRGRRRKMNKPLYRNSLTDCHHLCRPSTEAAVGGRKEWAFLFSLSCSIWYFCSSTRPQRERRRTRLSRKS